MADNTNSLVCTHCNVRKYLSEYYQRSDFGFRKQCKLCYKANANRHYRKRNVGFYKLTPAQRDTFINLRYVDMKSFKEIADEMDLCYGTIMYWKRTDKILLRNIVGFS